MITGEGWHLDRYHNGDTYIYEFWHKPVKDIMPAGRYIKYVQQDNEIIVIEDGPYLGEYLGRRAK
jgi:hypothetical protein